MVDGKSVNCEQVWREISNYLDGDVEVDLHAAMDFHFRSCQRCKSVLDGMQNVVHLYADERMVDVPAGFSRKLERRLAETARVQSSDRSTWYTWLIPVAALALFAGGLRWANSLTAPSSPLSERVEQAYNIPPDMTVVVSTGAKEFHVAGCEFIHNKDEVRTLTAREAIREGYVPCVHCMRKYLVTAYASRAQFPLEVMANKEFLTASKRVDLESVSVR